ncbi:hypothetical protein GCM10023185_18820 [Hymenobacter saemangeumensis]|uniref:Uncharacterized protein n=1 Tax=Hymenobacter saemangeumensis TaxID=1084522 RepID=A0ABP8IBY5_9BACT
MNAHQHKGLQQAIGKHFGQGSLQAQALYILAIVKIEHRQRWHRLGLSPGGQQNAELNLSPEQGRLNYLGAEPHATGRLHFAGMF